MSRAIALIDEDCFYIAVEVARKPELRGKPCGVVQYNPFGTLETFEIDDPRRHDSNSNGGLIAVSYEARAAGVKRGMRGDEARKICPELQLVTVPTAHGKADLTLYREQGAKVVDILSAGGPVERASVDEAYVDVTAQAQRLLSTAANGGDPWREVLADACESKIAGLGDKTAVTMTRRQVRSGDKKQVSSAPATTAIVDSSSSHTEGPDDMRVSDDEGDQDDDLPVASAAAIEISKQPSSDAAAEAAAVWWGRPMHEWSRDDMLLACGAAIINRLRKRVTRELGYTCSGGVAHNKAMAKLAAGLHKPNQQTVVPATQVPLLLQEFPITRIRGLGGKLGADVQSKLSVQTAGQLAAVPEATLRKHFGEKHAAMLCDMARGIDLEPVAARALPKSVSCGKTFYGKTCLRSLEAVGKWLRELAGEIDERLQTQRTEHKRVASKLTVHYTPEGPEGAARAQWHNSTVSTVSRVCPLRPGVDNMTADALAQVTKSLQNQKSFGIVTLFLGADSFADISETTPITSFFKKQPHASPVKQAKASSHSPSSDSHAASAAVDGPEWHTAKRKLLTSAEDDACKDSGVTQTDTAAPQKLADTTQSGGADATQTRGSHLYSTASTQSFSSKQNASTNSDANSSRASRNPYKRPAPPAPSKNDMGNYLNGNTNSAKSAKIAADSDARTQKAQNTQATSHKDKAEGMNSIPTADTTAKDSTVSTPEVSSVGDADTKGTHEHSTGTVSRVITTAGSPGNDSGVVEVQDDTPVKQHAVEDLSTSPDTHSKADGKHSIDGSDRQARSRSPAPRQQTAKTQSARAAAATVQQQQPRVPASQARPKPPVPHFECAVCGLNVKASEFDAHREAGCMIDPSALAELDEHTRNEIKRNEEIVKRFKQGKSGIASFFGKGTDGASSKSNSKSSSSSSSSKKGKSQNSSSSSAASNNTGWMSTNKSQSSKQKSKKPNKSSTPAVTGFFSASNLPQKKRRS